MRKKRLLFVMNNLNCGGAEKALLSLLQTMDASRYEIELFLFKHEGLFLDQLPGHVKVLQEPVHYQYFDMSITRALLACVKQGRLDLAFYRLCAGYVFRMEKNPARCEQRVWRFMAPALSQLPEHYDAVIGFLEKNPVYFSVEKVKAAIRLGFVHNDYDKLRMDPAIDYSYFERLDHLVTVSEECGKVLQRRFPKLQQKVRVLYNIVSPPVIRKLALEKADMETDGIRLLTIGRLTEQKGLVLAIEACRLLVAKGYPIKWYVIGEGEQRARLEGLIAQYQLQEHFRLLGLKENPYPYLKATDIYVQPSQFEGKSIAIDEAKILHKPIVVTNFSTAKDQITNRGNGLIVDMHAAALAAGIQEIVEDPSVRDSLVNQLSNEAHGTESEVEKLYAWIG